MENHIFMPKSSFWLVESSSMESFEDALEGTDIPIYSNVLAFFRDDGFDIDIMDAYRPKPEASIKYDFIKYSLFISTLLYRFSKWGVWSTDFGLEVFPADKWELRRDLSGVHFDATTAEEIPYLSVHPVKKDVLPPGYAWKDDNQHELVNVGGYYGDIWASLQQTTNFSYSMVNIKRISTIVKFLIKGQIHRW